MVLTVRGVTDNQLQTAPLDFDADGDWTEIVAVNRRRVGLYLFGVGTSLFEVWPQQLPDPADAGLVLPNRDSPGIIWRLTDGDDGDLVWRRWYVRTNAAGGAKVRGFEVTSTLPLEAE
jgi:hypothetical protein